jgi:hypothetical protein
MENMDSFKNIGMHAGTDKITHHGYDRFYPLFLDKIRDISGAILEIGIEKHHSLKMWLTYFPYAFIYGLDIGVEFEEERVRVFKADQSSNTDLATVLNMINRPVHFIIDDGSHIPEHQIATFNFFFRYLLEPGGVYIVEDIETSYWNKGTLYSYPTNYGYKSRLSFIERVKPLIDYINKEYLNELDSVTNISELGGINSSTADLISMMTFGQNCVIFVKKSEDDMKYIGREYRYKESSS